MAIDAEQTVSAVSLYRKALCTEMTGLVVVSIATNTGNKMKIRSSIQSHLRYFKGELAPSLGAEEQAFNGLTLLHEVLQSKISQALKLK